MSSILLQYSKIENFSKIVFLKKLHTKKMDRGALTSHNVEKLKGGDPLRFFNIHSVAKHELKKNLFLGKNLTMPKKTERRNPLGFSNIHSVAKHQKNAGGTDPLRKKNPKKNVSQCRKKLKGGDSLVSSGMVCYAENQVKPF